jgi:parvulin-like peptidyl-prolyl isomerase
MPYLVNGQIVPGERVRAEEQQLAGDPRCGWQNIVDETERARRLRAAAEQSAVTKTLVEQAAANDSRPIEAELIEREVQRQKETGGCRGVFDDTVVRRLTEQQFRLQRLTSEMVADAPKPTAQDVEAFYQAYGENFRIPEIFDAAHIVKHFEGSTEEQARAGIEAALTELESGAPFAEVASRHSDCQGKGSDLGKFPAGHMVEEFEAAIQAIEPGERTGIFRTAFGFHIAELRARAAPRAATFDEVREDIERVMTIQNQHQAYQRGVAELRTRADIRFVPEAQTAAS